MVLCNCLVFVEIVNNKSGRFQEPDYRSTDIVEIEEHGAIDSLLVQNYWNQSVLFGAICQTSTTAIYVLIIEKEYRKNWTLNWDWHLESSTISKCT